MPTLKPIFGLLILVLSCQEAAAAPKKEDLMAAMVFRLTKFITWPESAFDSKPSFTICFESNTPVFEKLSKARLTKWQGRDVVVQPELAADCHVAVLDKQYDGEQHNYPVLMIGLTRNSLDIGHHVGLAFSSGRLEFSIDRTKAADLGIEFSSELLSLAAEVR